MSFLHLTCRWFEWGSTSSDGEHKNLSLKSSESVLEKLKDVGQQLAMTFNHEGTLLAVGGEVKNFRLSSIMNGSSFRLRNICELCLILS